jgi:hypothetical protein
VATQILIVLSTSDYLLNLVIFSIVNGLKAFVDTNLISSISQNECSSSSSSSSSNNEMRMENSNEPPVEEALMSNLMSLIECVEYIVKIRRLDNHRPISEQVMPNLLMLLNTIFVDLTAQYPLIAIQMSKIIQILSLS